MSAGSRMMISFNSESYYRKCDLVFLLRKHNRSYVDERKQRSTFARMGRNGKDIII